MPSLEERVAYLEGRVEEHTRGLEELRSSIGRLDDHILAVDRKVDASREELAGRIDQLSGRIGVVEQKLGGRIDQLSGRIDALDRKVDSRIGAVDGKVDRFRDELSGRIEALDRKVSRQFTWIVGIQVAMFIAVIGSLIQ